MDNRMIINVMSTAMEFACGRFTAVLCHIPSLVLVKFRQLLLHGLVSKSIINLFYPSSYIGYSLKQSATFII